MHGQQAAHSTDPITGFSLIHAISASKSLYPGIHSLPTQTEFPDMRGRFLPAIGKPQDQFCDHTIATFDVLSI